MGTSVLAIIGAVAVALLPVLALWLKRRMAAKDNPDNQLQKQKDENAKAVLSKNPDDINRVLVDRIGRVRHPGGGDLR